MLLPYLADAASGVQTVSLQLEVPLDYPTVRDHLQISIHGLACSP